MICGKEKGAPLDNLYANNNNVTIWNEGFGKILAENPAKLNRNQIADVLEKHYQFVEINPDDKINFVLKSTPEKFKSLVG